ncbi:histidine kinase [Paraglaciecola sp.]|uniref:sensor histidine kinase n=1 Tax=Paraglaciecola sp. TaxID=1920173 RepID=UPI0030F3FDBD
MKAEGGGVILAIATWAAVMLICLIDWFKGNTQVALQQLPQTPFNVILVVSLFLLFILGFLLHGDTFNKRYRRARNNLGFWMAGIATAALSTIFYFGLVGILGIIIVTQLPRFYSLKVAIIIGCFLPAIWGLINYFVTGLPYVFDNVILLGLFNSFAILSSHSFINEQAEKLKSQQLVRELKATQLLLSNTSKRDERLRVARDLHDSLGHNLTALSLQLEVASHQELNLIKPHILQAKSIANRLLSDVRKTVSDIRDNQDFQLDQALLLLTQDIPNLPVKLDLNFDTNQLNIRLATVIFRCVQEAITNVLKHANATECLVSMTLTHKELLLRISDTGQSTHNIHFGNGLHGMVERVQQIDGSLSVENLSTGCHLTIIFPWSGH